MSPEPQTWFMTALGLSHLCHHLGIFWPFLLYSTETLPVQSWWSSCRGGSSLSTTTPSQKTVGANVCKFPLYLLRLFSSLHRDLWEAAVKDLAGVGAWRFLTDQYEWKQKELKKGVCSAGHWYHGTSTRSSSRHPDQESGRQTARREDTRQ